MTVNEYESEVQEEERLLKQEEQKQRQEYEELQKSHKKSSFVQVKENENITTNSPVLIMQPKKKMGKT